ncbi:MAG: helix-turn-helix domain-containing protein [Blautia sp.]|nr:helix-turn-helix domain-containing protein [Blautia sp.]
MNLLIVNDIVMEAQTMASEIAWKEYGIDQVYTAYSANAARDIILSNPVDILLSDIEMPDENGLSLIHWIQEKGFDIDCILLTCHADFAYAREGLSLGCQDYITLPAKYEEIAASVQKVCLRHQKHQDEKRLQDYGKNWLASQQEQLKEGEQENVQRSPAEISEKCVQFILDHIGDCELSVTDVANHVFLNPIYLNRIFKKEKGQSISQWIIKERMELASTLLLTTDRPAVEISYQIGYNNYPYFSTVFKKYFGKTPSQYVKEKKES